MNAINAGQNLLKVVILQNTKEFILAKNYLTAIPAVIFLLLHLSFKLIKKLILMKTKTHLSVHEQTIKNP
jgi:hypothetical protein